MSIFANKKGSGNGHHFKSTEVNLKDKKHLLNHNEIVRIKKAKIKEDLNKIKKAKIKEDLLDEYIF